MTTEEKLKLENYINRFWRLHKTYEGGDGEEELFSERCKGEVYGVMSALNVLGYFCERDGDDSDWRIVDWEE